MSSIVEKKFREFAQRARNNEFGRFTYSLSLAHSIFLAHNCGYKKITAIELGVANGHGLKDLAVAADYLEKEFDIAIEIVGFDTGKGLSEVKDYRDHPEIWHRGEFEMCNLTVPDHVKLILGNVADTIPEFVKTFNGIIGFVSIDLDLYSSTKSATPLFEMNPKNYLPAVPVYVDDVNVSIMYNPWCGEALALTEFNNSHTMRKFEEKNHAWRIPNFHVFHVLDHPIRNGVENPLHPLTNDIL